MLIVVLVLAALIFIASFGGWGMHGGGWGPGYPGQPFWMPHMWREAYTSFAGASPPPSFPGTNIGPGHVML